MQARAYPRDMNRLKNLLIGGKVYDLSNFTVDRKMQSYMACRNDLMIYMGGQTVVDEMSDDICSSIPLRSFEFVDFGDVPFRDKDTSLFTDVIGQIVSIEEEGQAWKWDTSRKISFRNLQLRDLREGYQARPRSLNHCCFYRDACSTIQRYKLDAVMEDTTGAMNIMIFGKQAQMLVGLSADKLVGETTGEQLSAIISSHHSCALVVGPHRGGFVVAGVLKDDACMLAVQLKMEAGGGGESS
ncbi:unnamed protein product [Urochloa decumbens]|uniref:Uncharacterized protein n=1 Tax=Urochloa decumbens TaxID=240449 RepID=A0ABC9ADV6_9POAL